MFGVRAPLLGSVPGWFAIHFLTNSTFHAWNEVRFEREFKQLHTSGNHLHSPQVRACLLNLPEHVHNNSKVAHCNNKLDTNEIPRTVLEPLDKVRVAYDIKEAISTPLVSTTDAYCPSPQKAFTTGLPNDQETIPLGDLGLPDGYPNTSAEIILSRTESPFSHSSKSSAPTSLTEATDTRSPDEEPPRKHAQVSSSQGISPSGTKLPKVGSVVDLDTKKIHEKHRDDKPVLTALAKSLRRKAEQSREDSGDDEENEHQEAKPEESSDEESEAPATLCPSENRKNSALATRKSELTREYASKDIFAGSSLFDAHSYSIRRQPNDLHKLGNNFVGVDRYRMSATLTRAERFEKLIIDMGEALEFAAHYFIHTVNDPEANVPGHLDITFTELVVEKLRRLKTGLFGAPKVVVGNQGRSIQFGFPNSAQLGLPGYHSRHNAGSMALQEYVYTPGKQRMFQYGLGVFRIDPPAEGPPSVSSPSTNLEAAMTRDMKKSTFAVFEKEKTLPREMPGLIGDEGNRYWPSQRAFSAIPEGHGLVPDHANGYRGLRLERDLRHPRWQRRLTQDISAQHASGPSVAVRHHSDQDPPVLQAMSMYQHSWMEASRAGRQQRGKDGRKGVTVLDGIMDKDEKTEDCVISNNSLSDSVTEFPTLEPIPEETPTLVEESKIEKEVQKEMKQTEAKSEDSYARLPARSARHMRRVRFQL